MPEKTCTRCKVSKDVAFFSKKAASPDGLQSRCRECQRDLKASARERDPTGEAEKARNRSRARYAKNPEKVLAANAAWRARNIDAVRQKDRKYRAENLERISSRKAAKYAEDPQANISKVREWRLKNPDRSRSIIARQNATRRSKPMERVRDGISRGVWRALKGRKAGTKVEGILGYSMEDLRRHLERQFLKGMNWDNYGKVWDIDHIIPLAYFNLTNPEECKIACNYNNLQPLTKSDNSRKKDKILDLDKKRQIDVLLNVIRGIHE